MLCALGDQVNQTWHPVIIRRQWSAAEAFSEFAASFCSLDINLSTDNQPTNTRTVNDTKK